MNSLTTVDSVEHLLERSRRLRGLATSLGRLSALSLDDLAGEDIWRGPRPDLCRTMLEHNQRQIHRQIDRLLAIARELERRAETAQTLIRLGGL